MNLSLSNELHSFKPAYSRLRLHELLHEFNSSRMGSVPILHDLSPRVINIRCEWTIAHWRKVSLVRQFSSLKCPVVQIIYCYEFLLQEILIFQEKRTLRNGRAIKGDLGRWMSSVQECYHIFYMRTSVEFFSPIVSFKTTKLKEMKFVGTFHRG